MTTYTVDFNEFLKEALQGFDWPPLFNLDLTTGLSIECNDTCVFGESLTITGFLSAYYEDPNNVISFNGYLSDANIKIYNGESLLGTVKTGSDGSYSFTYTPPSMADLSLQAVFENDVFYHDCSSIVKPVDIVGYELEVTCDKDILSYYDEESAVLTACFTNENVPVADAVLDYNIVHGGTVLDSGTLTTDNDGLVSLTYESAGVGDVEISFSYGIILKEIYVTKILHYTTISIHNTPKPNINIHNGLNIFPQSNNMLKWNNIRNTIPVHS